MKFMGCIGLLLAVLCAQADTNRYHLTVTWDAVTNAQWYALIVRTNGVEVQRRWSMTNVVTVSNLDGNLDGYRFTAIATNVLGVSDESAPAALRWTTVCRSGGVSGPWVKAPAVEFDPTTNGCGYLRLSNWWAETAMKKD